LSRMFGTDRGQSGHDMLLSSLTAHDPSFPSHAGQPPASLRATPPARPLRHARGRQQQQQFSRSLDAAVSRG
jgi:hypothetical protein